MKKIINIVKEVFGVVLGIDEISQKLSQEIYRKIIERFEQDKNTRIENIFPKVIEIQTGVNLINSEMQSIILRIVLKRDRKQHSNIISGAFLQNNTEQNPNSDGHSYEVHVDISISNFIQEEDNILIKKLESVLNHELHHAFEHVKRFGKKSSTKILSTVRQNIRARFSDKLKNNEILKEFMKVFYLNLPEERNARIQQIYTEMKEYRGLSFSELTNQMGRLAAFKDFIEMQDFKSDFIFRNITEKEQIDFINLFNIILKENQEEFQLEDDEIDYPQEPSKFFQFWEKQFHKNALKSQEKALKLMARFNSMNESVIDKNVFELLNENCWESVFGKEYFRD